MTFLTKFGCCDIFWWRILTVNENFCRLKIMKFLVSDENYNRQKVRPIKIKIVKMFPNKVANGFPSFTVFAKRSILDVWKGSEYGSDCYYEVHAQELKFSIKNFFSKCDQIRRKLRIWSHLLKKYLMENFVFFANGCWK